MRSDSCGEPLTYGSYLRVPELIDLQTPLAEPPVPDELLFIIGQQAEELWFKQLLHDLGAIVEFLREGEIHRATWLLDRANRILRVLSSETELLETISPADFRAFRGALRTASGLESEQFREVELASGLRDEAHLRMASRLVNLTAVLDRWPVSLHDVFLEILVPIHLDPVEALVRLYRHPSGRPDLYRLAEALSEYDLRFQEWRFHHLQVVERIIGDRSPGTGGSPGSPYLFRTLSYHFFPELWEARNRLNGEDVSPEP